VPDAASQKFETEFKKVLATPVAHFQQGTHFQKGFATAEPQVPQNVAFTTSSGAGAASYSANSGRESNGRCNASLSR
jgi:hypothetical protein